MNAYSRDALRRYGCPACGYAVVWTNGNGVIECGECRLEFSVAQEGEKPTPHLREGILARGPTSRRRFHPWRKHAYDNLIRRRHGTCVCCGQASGWAFLATAPDGHEAIGHMFDRANARPCGVLLIGKASNEVPLVAICACAKHRQFLAALIRRSVVAGGYISVEMIKLSLAEAKKEVAG